MAPAAKFVPTVDVPTGGTATAGGAKTRPRPSGRDRPRRRGGTHGAGRARAEAVVRACERHPALVVGSDGDVARDARLVRAAPKPRRRRGPAPIALKQHKKVTLSVADQAGNRTSKLRTLTLKALSTARCTRLWLAQVRGPVPRATRYRAISLQLRTASRSLLTDTAPALGTRAGALMSPRRRSSGTRTASARRLRLACHVPMHQRRVRVAADDRFARGHTAELTIELATRRTLRLTRVTRDLRIAFALPESVGSRSEGHSGQGRPRFSFPRAKRVCGRRRRDTCATRRAGPASHRSWDPGLTAPLL